MKATCPTCGGASHGPIQPSYDEPTPTLKLEDVLPEMRKGRRARPCGAHMGTRPWPYWYKVDGDRIVKSPFHSDYVSYLSAVMLAGTWELEPEKKRCVIATFTDNSGAFATGADNLVVCQVYSSDRATANRAVRT